MAAPTCYAAGCLLVLVLLAVVNGAADDACAAVPFKTLSFACASRCDSGQSCLSFNASAESPCKYEQRDVSRGAHCDVASASMSCDIMCFPPHANDSHAFKFYIAFNKTRATRPPQANSTGSTDGSAPFETPADALLELADDVPYETNTFVRRIGKLSLAPNITEVVISGGRTTKGTRGTAVNVEIDPEIFSNASQVTSVSLLNMDLSNPQSDIGALLPRHVLALDLSNTKLAKVPPSIQDLSTLETLTLEKNQLVEFPTNLSLPTLRTLRLRNNELSRFTTVMVSIELLDLVANNLAVFPYDVLAWANLHTLHVERNAAMAKVVFTKHHIAKLSSMEAFSMDSAALDASSCSTSQLQLLPPDRNASVCVLSETEWLEYQTQLVGSQRAKASSASAAVNATKVLLFTGFIGAAALAALFLWRKRWSKGTKLLDHSASSSLNGATTDRDIHSHDSPFEKFLTSKASDVAANYQVGHQFRGSSSTGSSPRKRYTLHSDTMLVTRRMRMQHIEDLRVIGSGGFAIVWLVRYLPQNRLLASKRLIKDHVTRQKTLDFVIEIKLNMQLDHPNIVQLIGVAWTIETDLQALLEYMPNGDLRNHLESTTPTTWDAQKLQLAIDIVEALVYVHSFSPPLVHRDLKSRNVLLADDKKAKLCDFGVSRFASVNNTMTTAVGTGKWLAPEVVAGSKSYDESCDVYAFGVIMTELDTHRLPFEDTMGPQGDRLPEVAVLQMVSSGQLQPTLSASCPEEIQQIALQCLAFDPADRPTTMQVAHWLRTVRQRGARGCDEMGS